MRERLQKLDYRSSPYLRPTQDWVCGWTAEGRPCHVGPDARGSCQATFECRPLRTSSGRWQCTRTELAGGRCELGALPEGTCGRPIPRCQPVRSLRAQRGLASRWSVALTIGLLLFFIGGPSGGSAFFSPGALSVMHSEVSSCAGCHTAFEKDRSAWVHAAFTERNERRDSERCLSCHNLGDSALRPHGVASDGLARVTERAAGPAQGASKPLVLAAARAAFAPNVEEDGMVACGTCHREHRGRSLDLTAMSDRRCIACHRTAFVSLSDGHPEFSGYPYLRRTRIAFDHASHIGKHFKEATIRGKAPDECRNCHMPAADQRTMLVRGFEATCGACHAAQIEGEGRATAKGLAVFNVAGLEVETLSERGAAIGTWPDLADGELTPFMAFLLAGDPDYAETRERLAGLDLLDLSDEDEDTLRAVERFAWSVKGLYFDLVTKGVPALEARLEAALGREIDTTEIAGLAGLLSFDTLRAAQRAWFPDLLREVPRHRAGEIVRIPAATEAAVDTAGDGDEGDGNGVESEVADADDDSILDENADEEVSSIADWEEGGDILDDEEEEGSILDDEEEESEVEFEADAGGDRDEGAHPGVGAPFADREDWSAAGGWYLDDFTLRYRPTGHEDRFLRAWLDATGQPGGELNRQSAMRVFERLAARSAPGLCVKCHSIDRLADGALAINWRSAHPVPNEQKFTSFFHGVHFSLLDQTGCLTCHHIDAKTDFAAGYKDRDPNTFARNFKPMERRLCAGCHTSAEAGDNCLTCHNYHVGLLPPAETATPKISEVMEE